MSGDAPTPLDLDAIRAMLGDRLAVTTRRVALDLLAEVERLRAEVTRLDHPRGSEYDYAWEPNASAFRGQARAVLAVVRDHQPVKPDREAIVEAMLGSDIITDDLRAEASAQGSTQREPFLCFADAVLDLWPGRSEATVKAEALRAAAEEMRELGLEEYTARAVSVWLSGHADRLAAEGGAS
jgi:hypothetical protein